MGPREEGAAVVLVDGLAAEAGTWSSLCFMTETWVLQHVRVQDNTYWILRLGEGEEIARASAAYRRDP